MQYRSTFFGVLLVILTMIVPAARAEQNGPEVELRAIPRIAIISMRPVQVRLTVVIKNADERHWCPGYFIEWGDGERSSRESDCAPFEESSPKDREQAYASFRHWYRAPGDMRITVRLRKAKETIRTEEIVIMLN